MHNAEPYEAYEAPQTSQMARLLHPHTPIGAQLYEIRGFGYTFRAATEQQLRVLTYTRLKLLKQGGTSAAL